MLFLSNILSYLLVIICFYWNKNKDINVISILKTFIV